LTGLGRQVSGLRGPTYYYCVIKLCLYREHG